MIYIKKPIHHNPLQDRTTQGSTTTTHNNPFQDKTGQPTTVQRQPRTIQKQYREIAIVCGRINKRVIFSPFVLIVAVIYLAPYCFFIIFIRELPFAFITHINEIGNISKSLLRFFFAFCK